MIPSGRLRRACSHGWTSFTTLALRCIHIVYARARCYPMPVQPSALSVEIDPTPSDLVSGIFEIKGLLHHDDDALRLELHASGVLSQNRRVETYTLPLEAIREVKTHNYYLFGRLVLYPASLRAFADLPGASGDKLVLKVPHSELHLLDDFAYRIQHQGQLAEAYTSPVGASPPSFPFVIPSVHGGLSRGVGHLSVDDDFIVFDVQVVALHLFKHDPEQIRVERSVIREARVRRGLRRDRLYLKPSQFELLAAMPGTHREQLRLDVPTAHRSAVEHLLRMIRRPGARPDASSGSR